VPGPINNPLNAGCHALIQEGAKLTTSIDDILSELAACIDTKRMHTICSENHQPMNPSLKLLLDHLEYTPMSIEVLIEKSGLTPEQVSSMLTELEIGGTVVSDAYGQCIRA
jgi:DNA processing protein